MRTINVSTGEEVIGTKKAHAKKNGAHELVAASDADTSRRRLSISLSPKSAEAFEWLKEFTDADTDSEVLRNALRIHYALLQRIDAGDKFFVRDAETGELAQIELFIKRVA